MLWQWSVLVLIAVATCTSTWHAYGEVDLDSLVKKFGQTANSRGYVISDSGKHLAALIHSNGQEVVVVVDRDTNQRLGAHPFGDVQPGQMQFLTEDHLLITFHNSTKRPNQRHLINHGGAVVFDLHQNKVWRVLGDKRGTGYKEIARVIGVDKAKKILYTPGYSMRSGGVDIYQVDLQSGRSKRFRKGDDHTVDWFMDEQGNVIAREDYHWRKESRSIYSYITDNVVFETEDRNHHILFGAVGNDNKSLVYIHSYHDRTVNVLDLETGEVRTTTVAEPGREVDGFKVLGTNRRYGGVKISGPVRETLMHDPLLTSIATRLRETFPESRIDLQSSSEDNNVLIYEISGNQGANDYYLLDRSAEEFVRVGSQYPMVSRADIAAVHRFEYTARDGLKLDAILTRAEPPETKNLPAVILPHGGPAYYDAIEFDWLSQLMARAGYLVMQPNFRGSTGRGYEFEIRGNGQSGLSMQDDITDGLHAIVAAGLADPKRVCIAGISYGGYAALMGGATTPDLYRCVISVAGVADLKQQIKAEQQNGGQGDTYINRLLDTRYGEIRKDSRRLEQVSPISHAADFVAPVLLVHGTDDYIVRPRHSERMATVLNHHNKRVRFVELKNEHHWLIRNPTRQQAAREILSFLLEHNPP